MKLKKANSRLHTLGACNNSIRKLEVEISNLKKVIANTIPKTAAEAEYLHRLRLLLGSLVQKLELVKHRREHLIGLAMSKMGSDGVQYGR